MQVAQGNISNLKIYGNDWPTQDGTAIRDYIHIMDLAEAHLAALEHLFVNESKFINLNIGTGIGTSVLELVNVFEDSNNIKIPVIFTERRKGDVGKVVADNSLAIKILNWRPKRNLQKMCVDGWNWKKLNPNGY